MRKALLGALALCLLAAGCTAVSHLRALQTPVPGAVVRVAAAAPTPTPVAFGAHTAIRGIGVDFYAYPGENITRDAATDIRYITSLHANAVLITFPFFARGPGSSAVRTTAATPSIAALTILVRAAQRAGLAVALRPLLDEKSLGVSRVHWTPPRLGEWLTSYQRFLLPYATLAQRLGVGEFFVATELDQFLRSPKWNRVDAALRRVYRGPLECARNWGDHGVHRACGDGVGETVDAYPPVSGGLSAGWRSFDRSLPRGTVETEIGIDAVAGARAKPYQIHWPATALDQSTQPRWFTAACHAAARTRLGGVYFWPFNVGPRPGHGPTLDDQGAWAGGPGARAISACFSWMERVSR